jgi:hypothetical protein
MIDSKLILMFFVIFFDAGDKPIADSKGKVNPRTRHEGPEGQKYRYTASLTSALGGVGGQRHSPAVLPPGMTRYSLYKRLGGLQGRS